ncbi:hypothetical protein [Winogradskyella haliclonae]|uniref:DUF2568 domain-containing protein n=1 Tax=Winogradskyella haliclonae TaxID=2048558 RepID=A0ABQ2C294_9FLAO|nr:hypothetical protein [Winogradskyella haliclonae]GGI58321.1 hypothetical protein GCM10011444_26300 [Winogradskyella haliclonae]
MKNLHTTNKVLTLLGLSISLTFWGGIFALPILGLAQIIMSIIIFRNKSSLSEEAKKLFYLYITVTITLAGTFRVLGELKSLESLMLLFVWMFVSAFLALFHLYITHKIKVEYKTPQDE